MNAKKRFQSNRELVNLMKNPYKARGIYTSNSLLHETVKFQIAYILMKQGYDVYLESEFKSGGKGDVIAIINGSGFIIEVLSSETEKRFNAKKDYYPEELQIVKVDAKEFTPETFKL